MYKDINNSIDIYDSNIIYHNNKRLDLVLSEPVSYYSVNTEDSGLELPTSLSIVDWSDYTSLKESYNGIKLNQTDNKIYISSNGTYEVCFSVLCTELLGGTPTIEFYIYKNGVAIDNMERIIYVTGTDETSSTQINFINEFNVNDTIEVWVKRTGGSIEIKTQISLTIKQIGG